MHSSRMRASHLLPYLGGGVICSREVCQHVYPPPVNRITDTCKNITLPNFVAGSKNVQLK